MHKSTALYLTTRQFAEDAGVTERLIRFYTSEGLLEATKEGGRVSYHIDQVPRLQNIRFAARCGLTLSQIREAMAIRKGSIMVRRETLFRMLWDLNEDRGRIAEQARLLEWIAEAVPPEQEFVDILAAGESDAF